MNISIDEIAVIDIEASGFIPTKDVILEVGIALLDLKNGNIKEIYNELVREARFNESLHDSWIFNNSDMRVEDILKAKPLDLVSLQKIFNKYQATAFNKGFDLGFLRDRGLIINDLPCPMLLATNDCKLPGRFGNYKWPSVQEAWNFYFGRNTKYIETHRGLDDAMHEAKIIYKQFQNGLFKV